MRGKWTKNLGIKFLSLLLAVIAWGVIINIDNPYVSKSFSGIKVELLNTEGIVNQEKVFEILEGGTIDVKVNVRRNMYSKLTAADFTVTADFNELYHDIVPIKVECKKANVEIVSRSTDYMRISLDDIATEQFFVKIDQEGTLHEGYVISEVEAQPSYIQITGAKSKIEKIDSVRCILNVSSVAEDFTVPLEPRICDKDMNYLSKDGLQFSSDSIQVSAKVQKSKSVKVNVKLQGNPAAGYEVAEMIFEPAAVEVAGDEKVLAQFDQIDVTVDITDQSGIIEKILNLAEYIPEGIRLVDNNANVNIRVVLEKKVTRDIQITPEQISFKNMGEGLDYQLNTADTLTVSLFGLSDRVNQVTAEELKPYVDLEGLEAGSHTVLVKVTVPEGVTVLVSPSISVNLYVSDGAGGEAETAPEEETGTE